MRAATTPARIRARRASAPLTVLLATALAGLTVLPSTGCSDEPFVGCRGGPLMEGRALRSFAFFDDGKAVGVGDAVIATFDGGSWSWDAEILQRLFAQGGFMPYAVAGRTAADVWAGTLVHFDGTDWKKLPAVARPLFRVSGDRSDVFFGGRGVVLRLEDDRLVEYLQLTGPNEHVNDLHVTGNRVDIAVGAGPSAYSPDRTGDVYRCWF